MTSTNASFLRYFTSERLHDVAPVACMVIFDESSLCKDQPVLSLMLELEAYDCQFRLYAFRRDIHLERVDLGILRITKVKDF